MINLKNIFVLTVYMVVSSNARPNGFNGTDNICREPRDIVFIVDSSTSIKRSDFTKQIDFIGNLASSFDIGQGERQTRVGVVTFSDTAHVNIYLRSSKNLINLKRRLKNVKILRGNTFTNKAIKVVRNRMFTRQYGARDGVMKIAIVITDGASQRRKKTIHQANLMREEGVVVIAIGVGSNFQIKELRAVASTPSSKFVYSVTNHNGLTNILKSLGNETCHVPSKNKVMTTPTTSTTVAPTTTSTTVAPTTTSKTVAPTTTSTTVAPTTISTTDAPTTTTTTVILTTTTDVPTTATPTAVSTTTTSVPTTTKIVPTTTIAPTTITEPKTTLPTTTAEKPLGDKDTTNQDCGQVKGVDLHFVLDSSTSIWIYDFKKQLKFVKDIVSFFDLNSTRVSLSTFSDNVHPVIKLGEYTDKEKLGEAIMNVKYNRGLTYTGDAIEYMRTKMVGRESWNENVQIAVVITDGISRQPQKTIDESKLAHDAGIYVYAIGVGTSVNKVELQHIASDPDYKYVFTVNKYDALDSIKAKFAARTCKVTEADYKKKNHFDGELACREKNIHVTFIVDSAKFSFVQISHITAFIRAFVSSVTVGSIGVRITVLRDSCITENLYLGNSDQVKNFLKTDTRPSFIASRLNNIRLSSDPKAANVAVMFVGDSFKEHDLVVKAATLALNKNVELYTFAIGDKVKERQLVDISSEPYDEHILFVNDYDRLVLANKAFVNVLCK